MSSSVQCFFLRCKAYKNQIFSSKNNTLETDLIQFPLSPFLCVSFISQQKTHFSYFLVIFEPFGSTHCKNKNPQNSIFWPINHEKLFRENLCPPEFMPLWYNVSFSNSVHFYKENTHCQYHITFLIYYVIKS